MRDATLNAGYLIRCNIEMKDLKREKKLQISKINKEKEISSTERMNADALTNTLYSLNTNHAKDIESMKININYITCSCIEKMSEAR